MQALRGLEIAPAEIALLIGAASIQVLKRIDLPALEHTTRISEIFMSTPFSRSLLAAFGLAVVTAPAFVAPAMAQADQSYRTARQDNRADAADVDDRMGRTIAAITEAEGRGAVTHKRANTLRDMIDRMRADYTRNKGDQGFVSAGELASYNRSLDQVDREISRRRR